MLSDSGFKQRALEALGLLATLGHLLGLVLDSKDLALRPSPILSSITRCCYCCGGTAPMSKLGRKSWRKLFQTWLFCSGLMERKLDPNIARAYYDGIPCYAALI